MSPKPEVTLPSELERQPIGAGQLVVTSAQSDSDLANEWVDGYEGHTRRAYERIGLKFLVMLRRPLRQATVEDYREAVKLMALKPNGSQASQATRATYTAAIKSFLNFAHQTGYLAVNAAPFVKIERQQRDLA